jgi:putative ABC transport system permease protein
MQVPIAQRNLFSDKGKLILHVAGIVATLMLIFLLLGFRDGMYTSLTAYIDNANADMIVAQVGSRGLFYANSGMSAVLHQNLDEMAGTAEVDHILVGDTIFSRGKVKLPVLVIGYNWETGFGGAWNIGTGRTLQGDDEILIDSWLAWRSGVEVGDSVDVLGKEFTVVGLTKGTASWMSPYIFISLSAAEEVLQLSGDASFFLLRLSPDANRDEVANMITTEFDGLEVFTPAEMAATDRKFLATILDSPIWIMLIISAVIAIAVMGLITYNSILNRLAEFGTLKAIGASNNWLRWLIIKETLFRNTLGFLFSIVVSYLFAALIEYTWPQFTVTIRPELIPIVGFVALIMTLFSALLPIQQIAKVDPSLVFKA